MESSPKQSFYDSAPATGEGDKATAWVKPLPNTVKVSVDATVFEDRGGVGFGLVDRDSDDLLIEARAIVDPHLINPMLAETMAIKKVLNWIDGTPWQRVMIKSNCLAVIQAIRCTTSMRSHFGRFVEDCRVFMQRLNNISLFFVKRSANTVAHKLARQSYIYSGRVFDRRSVPIKIKKCINLDLIQ
ncbi:uncharacterized protein LOC141691405 [Apium graveolens]|uniref:uncharacterized protein LOC141691405 n=1 Tax=Apium graveolens TaxID=4045 RepID=UPI003D7930BD